ncbi:MAG: carbohydrate ABC transporter permease [Fimbriimonas sp.]
MSKETLYSIGTLLAWFGGFAVLRALVLGVRAYQDRDVAGKGSLGPVAVWLVAAAAAIIVGSGWAGKAANETAPIFIPLTWVVMPLGAWAGGAGIIIGFLKILQGLSALSLVERKSQIQSCTGWFIAGAIFLTFTLRDPGTKFEWLRGGIPMQLGTAIGLLVLAVASVVAMVISERASRVRAITTGIATHAALLAGSVVFGLPFAWLVITSFKEDRDMSSANGIIWVPKVKQQVPYLDPKLPTYEGTFEGQTVQATAVGKEPDGRIRFDILRPMVMRGMTFKAKESEVKIVPRKIDLVYGTYEGKDITGRAIEDKEDGSRLIEIDTPASLKGQTFAALPGGVEQVRNVGLRTQNYSEALDYLPPETNKGLMYVKNTLLLVILSVIGTILSSSVVAYGFSRLRFPGKNILFTMLLSTMMLPAAVTLLPQFLIFRQLGWIDSLLPLWVPTFFASAFNVFLLRQFFMGIPMELEDAAKIDGCTYLGTFWRVMLPQIKPALAVVAIWTFMGAWNNFMGPLIYVNSPENMTISYAVQLFNSDRASEPGMLMAFTTMAMVPVLLLFIFAQRYFIEGVTMSGLGGR